MKNNPLQQLEPFGQSIWLDYIRRDLIVGGGLRRLIGRWTTGDDLESSQGKARGHSIS
jgi:hypothetical protein